jgi:hypothetical protein
MGFEPTTSSLEGWNSTAELHPQRGSPGVEGDGFEPSKAWSRQIYSLLPLATREPLRMSSRNLSLKPLSELAVGLEPATS